MKVIIQAGGKGTRLGRITKNKPKAIVEYEGKPLIFHIFESFKNSEFIIIGDYKLNILKKYLSVFAKDIKYRVVKAKGTGTLSGLKKSLSYVEEGEQLVITWCDIVMTEDAHTKIEDNKQFNNIITSNENYCRYSIKNGKIEHKPSYKHGVIGLFSFKDKNQLLDIPKDGEFVKYLSNSQLKLNELQVNSIKEFSIKGKKTRYFNESRSDGTTFYKKAKYEEGLRKLGAEYKWYTLINNVSDDSFYNIPKNITINEAADEISMGLIKGIHPYDVKDSKKLSSLKMIVNSLHELHSLGGKESDYSDLISTYYTKTVDRLNAVRKLLPKSIYININGKKCKNPIYRFSEIRKYVEKNLVVSEYNVIHGDPTFSNMMITKEGKKDNVVLFDPRAHFGKETLYGDALYDWAKLYYSIKGNYDNFNKKNFDLSFEKNNVYINVESQGYEFLEKEFFYMIGIRHEKKIKFLHALIWLSLTSYYWEDYDCIMGAFYLGAYYLEEVL